MAKLNGPEEFFEVFHRKQAGAPGEKQPDEQRVARPRVNFGSAERTVTLKLRTLVIGAASSVLLMILCYFVGVAGRSQPPTEPGGQRPVQGVSVSESTEGGGPGADAGEATRMGVGQNEASSADNAAQPPRTGYVLVVAAYEQTATGRNYAYEVIEHLKKQEVIRTSPVSVGAFVMGNHLTVCIGPFASSKSASARRVEQAVKNMTYRDKAFSDAYFTKTPPR
jgi:hypothetical protein